MQLPFYPAGCFVPLSVRTCDSLALRDFRIDFLAALLYDDAYTCSQPPSSTLTPAMQKRLWPVGGDCSHGASIPAFSSGPSDSFPRRQEDFRFCPSWRCGYSYRPLSSATVALVRGTVTVRLPVPELYLQWIHNGNGKSGKRRQEQKQYHWKKHNHRFGDNDSSINTEHHRPCVGTMHKFRMQRPPRPA